MKYLAITAVLCIILAGASFAGNVTMTEVITGGNLTLSMTPSYFSLPEVTLGGFSSTTVTYVAAAYYVEDSRGSGNGWNLGFNISQFTSDGTPTRTIPVANYTMKLTEGNMSKLYGQEKDETNGPKSLYTNYTNIQNVEVKFITAAANYGMGKYSVWPNYALTVPAEAYAGTYTATLTSTLNNTP